MTVQRLRLEHLEDRIQPTIAGLFALAGGEGGVPRVRMFESAGGTQIADFSPFEPTFTGGVTVALGDVNGDGFGDLIVGAGPGGGPRVRIFDGQQILTLGPSFQPNNPNSVIADFFAFEASQRGGVNVASGDFAGVPVFNDVVVGAGPGGGPRVRVFDGQRITLMDRTFTGNLVGDTIADFFAFESTFRNGVTVAATPNLAAGLFSDLIVAPGFGGGPRVRLVSGNAIATRTMLFDLTQRGDVIADFFAYDPNFRSGVFVASADVNGDGFPDIITGPGPGVQPLINVFNGSSVYTQREQFNVLQPGAIFDQFFAADTTSYANGVTVGASRAVGGSDFMLHGIGGQGLLGQAVVSRYAFTNRVPTLAYFFDPNFFGPVNVSN